MDYLSSSETLVSLLVGIIALLGSLKWSWSKLTAKLSARQNEQEKNTLDKCPAKRFLALFEAHGVYSSQIPNFFGHGLSIADCSAPEKLIEKLTEEILREAAQLFAVKLEWLHGATNEIYNVHNFYKHPGECEAFVVKLKESGNEISGYALTPNKISLADDYNTAIVFNEVIGHVSGRPIERCHILGHWTHTYWKCRGYFAACASIALNHDIWLIGNSSEHKWLSQFSTGNLLPSYDFELENFHFKSSSVWYVDEFLESPKKYIEGVSPEDNKFGLKAAIELWLELESQGYMCIEKYSNRKLIRKAYLSYKI